MADSNPPSARETMAQMETTEPHKRFKRRLIGIGLLFIAGAFIVAANHHRAAEMTHYQIQPQNP